MAAMALATAALWRLTSNNTEQRQTEAKVDRAREPVALAPKTDAGRNHAQTAAAESSPGEPWKILVGTIASQTDPPGVRAARLAAVLPTLPPDGQLETARQVVALQTDEDYEIAENIYFSPGTPEAVKRLVFEDLMNRPNSLKLPVLVRTVGAPDHPLYAEALDNLQLFVGRDLGNDPSLWQSAVNATLAERRKEQETAGVNLR